MRYFNKKTQSGVSLVEVLIAIAVITVASIGTLSFFTYGLAGVGKESHRRAAMERARQRLDALMAFDISAIAGTDSADGNSYWIRDTNPGSGYTWTRVQNTGSASYVLETVPVDELATQRVETTVQRVNDPSAGTTTLDTVALTVKVWFTPGNTSDDDYNRVYIRTLRTP